MGLQLKDLVTTKEIDFKDLNNKVLVFDTFNLLYQFLTTIRQSDGSPLTDDNGEITSHLAGLFNRTMNLLQHNIKPVFVFDGVAPELKKIERERRNQIKLDAEKEYEVAKENGDIQGMKKYAQRTSRLTPEMVTEAKKLISAMGLSIVSAPSEGEAQAAHMVKKGDAYATVSQDFDTLLFGTPRLIRNLSVSGKRKKPNSPIYVKVMPEIISLNELLEKNRITNEELIVIGMLIGTDYNYKGIKGIGPAKALKLVKEAKGDYEKLFSEVKWEETFGFSWKSVFETLSNIPTTDDYELKWDNPNEEEIIQIMCDNHGFNRERIESQIDKLKKSVASKVQKGLGDFF